MLYFHATLHARSPEVVAGVSIELRQAPAPTLIVPPTALAHPFPLTFEEMATNLERLERMFVEPDGSFVWVSPAASGQEDRSWQLDGNLYDRNGKLLLVDLKGSCTPAALDQLLSCVGWPATSVMFELAREAVFLAEAEFRTYAARSPAGGVR